MTTIKALWLQVRYQNKVFWRTPVAAFFTIGFPLMFLFVFVLLFGNAQGASLGSSNAQFFAPGLAVYGAVSATYSHLAIATTIHRDEGILKRVRGTPVRPWLYIAGRSASAIWIAAVAVIIMLATGVVLFDVTIFPVTLMAFLVTFLVGVGCFSALGLLLAAVSPSGDATPAMANAFLLLVAFFSDVFVRPSDQAPAWISTVADVFPLRHFVVAIRDLFDPTVLASKAGWLDQFQWDRLAVIVVWMIVAAMLAVRLFVWEPRGGERKRSARRVRRAST